MEEKIKRSGWNISNDFECTNTFSHLIIQPQNPKGVELMNKFWPYMHKKHAILYKFLKRF